MINYLSLNSLSDLLNQWVTIDKNIQTYGFGLLSDVNAHIKSDQKYPGMWVQPTPATMNETVVNRTLQIVIYDLPTDEGGVSPVSDCEEIAFRLIRFLTDRNGEFEDTFQLTGTPVVTPFFREKYLDGLSGVMVDLQVETAADWNSCNDNVDYSSIQLKHNII